MSIRNELYAKILTVIGGGSNDTESQRNETLSKCVIAAGGSVRNSNNRNMLLEDYLLAIS